MNYHGEGGERYFETGILPRRITFYRLHCSTGIVAVRISRALALLALAVSAALFIHSVQPNGQLCPFAAECEQVQASPFGQVLGIPLPAIGLLAFGLYFGLTLAPLTYGRLCGPLAVAIAVGGAVLMIVQFSIIRHVCAMCLVVDSTAVLIGISWLWARREPDLATVRMRQVYAWAAAGAVALVTGVVLGAAGSPEITGPAPPQIRALWTPDKINVIEVADFDCPHCRRMHSTLMQFVKEQGDQIHFARLTVPMPAHEHARDASRAFLCAQKGKEGDAIAERLFRAVNLEPQACEQLAAAIGLSLPEFRACVRDPAVDRQLDADKEWVQAASPRGLPVVWIQDRMLFGEQSLDQLREAMRKVAPEEASP
jgi:uncharacterized membrane protein/predicted DsbA family dithiol-disulfide isomerase